MKTLLFPAEGIDFDRLVGSRFLRPWSSIQLADVLLLAFSSILSRRKFLNRGKIGNF
jgi:hypothetical protein